MSTSKKKGAIDIVFILILFIVSISIHYYYVTYLIRDITDKMQLFQTASIHSGKALEYMPHGASYLYAVLLNFLFYVIGNKILVPVILQIVMKILGLLLLFFALRMSVGKISAFITTTMLLFLPMNYELLNQITPIVMTVFFICIQFFFFALLLKGIRDEVFTNYGYGILFIAYGIICGITIYADVLGIIFGMISIIWLLFLRASEEKVGLQSKVLQIVCILLGTIIGLLGICCFISSSFGMSFEAPYINYFTEYILRISISDYYYFGLVIGSLLAGLVIQTICNQVLYSKEVEEEEYEDEFEDEFENEEEEIEAFDKDFEEEEIEPLKSIPLDNPLPVPKRHEKKEMNYALELSEEELEFDFTRTKENDDFDIE